MTEPTAKGTRAGAIARARSYVESGAFETDLARRVAVRTESQLLPASLPELQRYLEAEMTPAFERLGFATRIYPNPRSGQGPVLLATRIEDQKLPTVLGYGHGDVIRGLEDQWTKGKGPWVTARDGDRLYGRGTADNKGQHTINMAALDAVRQERGGRLGFNAKFIIELLPHPPARIAAGSVKFAGEELTTASPSRMEKIRGAGISMVFQEPMTSLNPVFTIGEQIMETVRAHERLSANAQRDRAIEMLDRVGIPSATKRLNDYPHQLSGGQRQRVMIAMSLACRPKLLIADEPTTALDVTIQAQVLDLLMDLRDELGMAIIVITHNMGVIAEVADRVLVMYAGRIVEQSPVANLFDAPQHPYTKGLLACVPTLEQDRHRLIAIPGSLPEPALRPAGCCFAPRCTHRIEACGAAVPLLTMQLDDRAVACIRADELIAS